MPPSKKALSKETLGDWEDLENPAVGLPLFENGAEYAFDTSRNDAYHARHVIRVEFDPNVVDFSPIFENAFDQLRAIGGGTLQLGVGEYVHSRNVVVPSYCCLRGAGMDATVVRVANDAPQFKVAGCIRLRCTRHSSVRDLTQDGNSEHVSSAAYGRFGIYTHLACYTHMRCVRVRNNHVYAFDPHGDKGPPPRHGFYLVIEDCVSENNGLDGVTVDMSMYVSVLRVRAVGNARHGINICTGSRYVLVAGCLLENNGTASGKGYALVAQNNDTRGKFGTHSVVFRNNVVRACTRGGVALRDVHHVTVEHCRFEHPGETKKYAVYELQATKRPVLIRSNCLVGSAERELKVDDECEEVCYER